MTAAGGARPLRLLVMASVRWYNAAAAYAVELARAMQDRGHRVMCVVRPGSPPEAEAARRNLPIWSSADLTARGPVTVFSSLRDLRRLLAAFDPDLVNAHRAEDHLLAALALRGRGVPLVRTRGDVRPPRNHAANRALYRRATAHHVAAADFMPERFFTPMGVDANRVTVIRPGMDVETFSAGSPSPEQARRDLDLGPGPWIGLVGRFTAAKGHRTLLGALTRLDRFPRARVLLSGEANEIDGGELRREATRLGIADRVEVRPRMSDVRGLLRALDVLAVPSVASEAIPRIALEGLALGVPTVASQLNALPEVVGDAGLLVPPGDEAALARALARALDDEAFRRRAAAAGPDRIRRRYDRRTQIALTERLFGELVSGADR